MTAYPLTELLKKDAFKWNPKATGAFNSEKIVSVEIPILELPDFSKSFLIQIDALGLGMAAILTQDGHLVACFSKKLYPTLQHSSTYVCKPHAITAVVQ